MMNKSISNYYIFILGLLSGLAFAPIFFLPTLFSLSFITYKLSRANSRKETFIISFIFGFGHFLSSLYWSAICISVYINEFWWAIPFVLFGLPILLSFFIICAAFMSFPFKNSSNYPIIFSISWVFMEWVRSWLFTGFPWNLLGYVFAFSDILLQSASVIGVFGLSFIAVYISTSSFYLFWKQYREFFISIFISCLILASMVIYGIIRIDNNPVSFSNIKVRLVQPSIPQSSKWDEGEFWKNLDSHIDLSEKTSEDTKTHADIIIWSESAIVVPYEYERVRARIMPMLEKTGSILISGGISYSDLSIQDPDIYVSLYGISVLGTKIFEYHKSHLVPFGEYVPMRSILQFKKLTHGMVDYTKGKTKLVYIDKFDLWIKPLICYESIFPSLVRSYIEDADIMINVTNDSWYGNFSEPYQHFYMSKMRSSENGIGMLRVANNGISAFIDPLGRTIKSLSINEISYIESFIPIKLANKTIYTQFGDGAALIFIFIVLIIQLTCKHFLQPNC